MKNYAFNDGDKFCVVIQNYSTEEKQSLIKSLGLNLIEDLDAKPTGELKNLKVEKAKESNNEKTIDNSVLILINSLITFDKPNKNTDLAFKTIVEKINLLPVDTTIVKLILRNYLNKRFRTINPEAFFRMNNSQYNAFFDTFGKAISKDTWNKSQICDVSGFLKLKQAEREVFIKNALNNFIKNN